MLDSIKTNFDFGLCKDVEPASIDSLVHPMVHIRLAEVSLSQDVLDTYAETRQKNPMCITDKPLPQQKSGNCQNVKDYALSPIVSELINHDNMTGTPIANVTEWQKTKKILSQFERPAPKKEFKQQTTNDSKDLKLTQPVYKRNEKIVYDQYNQPYMLCVEKSFIGLKSIMLAVSLSGVRYTGQCTGLKLLSSDNDKFHMCILTDFLYYENGCAKIKMQKIENK